MDTECRGNGPLRLPGTEKRQSPRLCLSGEHHGRTEA